LDELRSGLDRLRNQDLDEIPASALDEYLLELRNHINGCEGEFSRRLAGFDNNQGYATSGALCAKAWLRWQCDLTASVASDRVEVARLLASLPQTTEAFAAGDISYQHAAMIARTAVELGDKMEANAEGILVNAARELDPGRLRIVAMHLRHCLQPDCVLRDANDVHAHRYLYLSQTLDGIFRLDGQLDADGGAMLQTALDSLMVPPAPDDERNARQRRADAMVELARRQLDGGALPEVGGHKPHLMVTVDMAALSKQPGSFAAELEWAQPIPAETARRLACDAAITPILVGGESPQAGPTSRVVSAPIKRAVVVRDKGCRFPGCDQPPAWTDVHHLKHWADGGGNGADNLILLCRRHHRRVHEEGWTMVVDGGELLAIPP
jgi:uncharacterized protein DUF222/HNH endonuclease